eukprot:SAG22_NODE_1813_length_3512_cov_103.505703_1_plen_792_part_10
MVVIGGATGPNADKVNGRYEFVDREVYRKVGDPGKWLFVNKTGEWYVGSTAEKDARKTESGGWAHPVAAAGGLPPVAGAVKWKVAHGNGNWVEQTVRVEVLDAAAARREAQRHAEQVEAAWASDAAQQVMIGGATGPNADKVNGRYEFVDREVYRKFGDSTKWLFVSVKSGYWLVGNTAEKDARKTKSSGWAHPVAAAGGLPPVAGAVKWKVAHGNGNWVEQTVRVEVLDAAAARQESQWRAEEVEAAWASDAAQQVMIGGATGPNADKVNGRYEFVDREVYRKVGDPGKWLFVNKTGEWYVGNTAEKDARKTKPAGRAYQVAAAGGLPPAAGAVKWQVAVDGAFVEQTVRVEVLDAAAARREAQRHAEQVEAAWAAGAAQMVVIGGATGPNADKVNGRYEFVDREVYRKFGDSTKWLFVSVKSGYWLVGNTAEKDARKTKSSGWAHPVAAAGGLPPAAGVVRWKVTHGKGNWVEQTVRVEVLDEVQVVLAEVAKNGMALEHATEGMTADREFMLAAVAQNGYALRHAAEGLKGDREVVLAAVAQNAYAMGYAAAGLKPNREFMLAAVARNGGALQYAAEGLKGDREVVLAAVARDGWALQYASRELRADRQVVMAAVRQCGAALEHASPELRGLQPVVLTAVAQDGNALRHAAASLRADREVVLAAAEQHSEALFHADGSVWSGRQFVIEAIARLGFWVLEYAPAAVANDRAVTIAADHLLDHRLFSDREIMNAAAELQADREVVQAAVGQSGDPRGRWFAAAGLKADKEFALAMIEQKRWALHDTATELQ